METVNGRTDAAPSAFCLDLLVGSLIDLQAVTGPFSTPSKSPKKPRSENALLV